MRFHILIDMLSARTGRSWLGASRVILALMLLLATGLAFVSAPLLAQQQSPEFDMSQVTIPSGAPAAAFGARAYQENCAPCHGIQGMGDGPTAADLPGPPTAFADPDAVWEQSPAELFHTAKFGRMDKLMPPWRNELSDDAIWQTLAYAWSLHSSEQETIQGADGYAVSCAGCHGETGAGDGPDATEAMPDFSDPSYAVTMSQAGWLAGWQEAHLKIGEEWTQDEQRQVLEYMRTFTLIPPWESAFRSGEGVIRGTVQQGTPGADVPDDTMVTLEAFVDFQPMSTFTTTVDADGGFEFTGLTLDPNSADPAMVYLASVSSQGIRYSSPIVSLTADAPAADTSVMIYEVTDDPSGLTLDRVHWIVDSQPGALIVLQVLEVGNGSDRTYVGESVEGIAEPVTVAFGVPQDAVELSFENGALGQRFRQVGDLVYDTTPVVPGPGTRQIVMQYAVPFDGDQTTLEQQFEYPVSRLNLLVADLPGLEVEVPGLEPSGTQDFQGRIYQVWQSGDTQVEPIAIRFSGLLRSGELDPRAVESSGVVGSVTTAAAATPYEPWMAWAIGILAALALAGVVTWSWQQGRLESADTPENLRAQRDDLMQRIARLDDLHALGEISDDAWRGQRAQLKNKLIEIDGRLAQGNGSQR